MKNVFGLLFVASVLVAFTACSDQQAALKEAPTPPAAPAVQEHQEHGDHEGHEGHALPEGGMKEHPPLNKTAANTSAPDAGSIEKADSGAIADIFADKEELKGKKISVRGKVMKFSPMIMGRNWIHLQDGTGEAGSGTNDLTITSGETVKVGDIVLVTGTVVINKDLGAGYTYDVIIEDATFKTE